MCANNRKALEKEQDISNVTVTYKPYVNKQSKTEKPQEIMEWTENVTEESIDTNETGIQCSELTEDEVTKSDLSRSGPTEKIIVTSTFEAD